MYKNRSKLSNNSIIFYIFYLNEKNTLIDYLFVKKKKNHRFIFFLNRTFQKNAQRYNLKLFGTFRGYK
jgi:hypothetical protein